MTWRVSQSIEPRMTFLSAFLSVAENCIVGGSFYHRWGTNIAEVCCTPLADGGLSYSY